jgi:hypothetical protein
VAEAGPSKYKSILDLGKDEIYVPQCKDTDEEIRAELDEVKKRRAASREVGEEIRSMAQIERGLKMNRPKQITVAEFNYYNDVNQSCATRLAIVNLAEKSKILEKKGHKKVSDDDDDSEEREVLEIKEEDDDMGEGKDGSYISRRKIKHTKKKRKQKLVLK